MAFGNAVTGVAFGVLNELLGLKNLAHYLLVYL